MGENSYTTHLLAEKMVRGQVIKEIYVFEIACNQRDLVIEFYSGDTLKVDLNQRIGDWLTIVSGRAREYVLTNDSWPEGWDKNRRISDVMIDGDDGGLVPNGMNTYVNK